MARPRHAVTLDEVVQLARQLSSVDKVRLIEQVAPEIARDLLKDGKTSSISLLGLTKDLGPAPSAD